MRLWHYELLPYLPKSQLLAQKSECDLIWKDIREGRKTNHVLINYIWKYAEPDLHLSIYYSHLEKEFKRRGFKFNCSKNARVWMGDKLPKPFSYHQDNGYLMTCYFNLREKYMGGQKDFDSSIFKELYEFVDGKLDKLLNYVEAKI